MTADLYHTAVQRIKLNPKKYPTELAQICVHLQILNENLLRIFHANEILADPLILGPYLNFFDDKFLIKVNTPLTQLLFEAYQRNRITSDFEIWQIFFHRLMCNYPTAQLILRGGSVIPLLIGLCLGHQNIKAPFLYDLVKDYDFMVILPEAFTDSFFMEGFGDLTISVEGKRYKKNRVHNFISVQNKLIVLKNTNPIRLGFTTNCLIECSVRPASKPIADSELPFTAMELPVSPDLIDPLFDLLKHIYHRTLKQTTFPLDLIRLCKYTPDGLFNIPTASYPPFSKYMIELIQSETAVESERQLLICAIRNPTILSRWHSKNVPKIELITNFLGYQPAFLPNISRVTQLLDGFCTRLQMIVKQTVNKFLPRIELVTTELNAHLNEMARIECLNALQGIGGNPAEVISFMQGDTSLNSSPTEQTRRQSILTSPRLLKCMQSRSYNAFITSLPAIKTQCDLHQIYYEDVDPSIKYSRMMKNSIDQTLFLKKKLFILYKQMFRLLDILFQECKLERWREYIKETRDNLDYPLQIFYFAPDLTYPDTYPRIYPRSNVSAPLGTSLTYLFCEELARLCT